MIKLGLAITFLFASTLSCDSIMDTSIDTPHPPMITGVQFYPEAIHPNDSLLIAISYYDVGEDIMEVHIKDKNSGSAINLTAP